jgi:rhamnose transport system permease protein
MKEPGMKALDTWERVLIALIVSSTSASALASRALLSPYAMADSTYQHVGERP